MDSRSSIRFAVWPWEAEWKIISHAALLTILDVARQDHFQRVGFLKLMVKSGWFVPVASIHMAFKKPIYRFDRIEATTRVSFWDDTNILIEHEVLRDGKLMATCIVRGKIKKGRETVDPRGVVAALGGGSVDKNAGYRLHLLLDMDEQTTSPAPSRTDQP